MASPECGALRLTTTPENALAVRRDFVAFARSHGVSEDDLTYLSIALGEALANAIEHAHIEFGIISVEVKILSPGTLIAVVSDDGCGFEPAPFTEPKMPNCDAHRGRGLPIIRQCSDIFAILSAPNKGTAVTFGRFFDRISLAA